MKNNCDVSGLHGDRADRATHMAALWKRCARNLWRETNAYVDRLVATNARLERERNTWKASAEKAEHMAALWKRCAKKSHSCEDVIRLLEENSKIDVENRYNKSRAEKAVAEIATLKEENDFLREHAETQAERIDELPELWAEIAKLRHELAALKKDARMVAHVVLVSNEIEVGQSECKCEYCQAAHRIIEATKAAREYKIDPRCPLDKKEKP